METDTETADTAITAAATPSIFSEGTTFAADWADSLEGDYEAYRPSAAKFAGKDVREIVKSYGELEKMMGKKTEGMIRLPSDASTPEEISSYRAAMGIPESADGYEIDAPELPDGVDWDASALDPFKAVAMAEGITPKALNALVAKQFEVEAGMREAQDAEILAQNQALINEWGDGYAGRLADIEGRVAKTGIDLSQPYISRTDALKALDLLAKDFRPDNTNTTRPVASGVSATARITEINNDPEFKNTMSAGHKELRAERLKLLMSQ